MKDDLFFCRDNDLATAAATTEAGDGFRITWVSLGSGLWTVEELVEGPDEGCNGLMVLGCKAGQ